MMRREHPRRPVAFGVLPPFAGLWDPLWKGVQPLDTVLTLDHFSKIYPNGRGAGTSPSPWNGGRWWGCWAPTGRGKTTIMKSITGMAQPSEGTITVFGANVAHREQALAKVGSLIEQPALYEHLTAQDHLRMAARYYRDVDQARMDRVLEIVGLAPYKKERCGKFSLGMKQRMGLGSGPPLPAGTDDFGRAHQRPGH